MENVEVENADNEALVNVQSGLSRAYYGKLVERAKANDRSARGEATRILKAVLDGNIQFVDPMPVYAAEGCPV